MATGARPLSQVSRLARYRVRFVAADGVVTEMGAMSKKAAKDQVETLAPGEGLAIYRVGPGDLPPVNLPEVAP